MLPDVLSIGPKLHRNGEMTERDRGMKRLSNLSLGSVKGVILGRFKNSSDRHLRQEAESGPIFTPWVMSILAWEFCAA